MKLGRPKLPVYYKPGQGFFRDKRKVGPKAREYKNVVVQWVCGQIAQAKSLESVLPVESTTTLPNILEFMRYVNSSEETKEMYNEARHARYTLLSERLIAAVQRYEQNPTKDGAEVLKAINSARVYLEKGGLDQNSLTIEVKSMVPVGFWTKTDYRVKGSAHEDK